MSSSSNTKRTPATQPPARSRGGIVLGIFIGILIGGMIAAGAAYYFTRSSPFQQPAATAHPADAPRPAGDPRPVALPGKPGDRPVEKPQFDFYRILPQGGEQPPATAPAPAATPATPPVAATGERYFLQAGAFESPSEADNLKARLALMGIEASAQRSDVPDKGTLHRVRVGPFASVDALAPTRARLAEVGINATIIRIRPRE